MPAIGQAAQTIAHPTQHLNRTTRREKIFLSFSKEIPYSCEVAVTGFKDQERLLKMNATIYTTRESHVPILIGTKGE